jgi:hypothetical protein
MASNKVPEWAPGASTSIPSDRPAQAFTQPQVAACMLDVEMKRESILASNQS